MKPSRTRSVNHQYFIRSAPADVFSALTEPAWLVRWLANQAEFEPRRGGQYLLGWTDGPVHTGTVVEFRKGRRIGLAWAWPGVRLTDTVLRFSIHRKGDGTVLEIDHIGFPRREKWVDLYGGAEWGWTYFAMNLKSVLETGRDLRSPEDG